MKMKATVAESENDQGFATWEIFCEECDRITTIERDKDNYDVVPGCCPYCGEEVR
jgi:hypothetical protein